MYDIYGIEKIDFTEIAKLDEMLTKAHIPHTIGKLYDGKQIRVFYDAEMEEFMDDAVIHFGSHGVERGLLETYCLSGCDGYETAEQVFKGWAKKFAKHWAKTVEKTMYKTLMTEGGM